MSSTLSTKFIKLKRKGLSLIFHFDKWHISPLSERPYAFDIIKFCNNYTHKNSIVEIGCGLGDIVRNVDFIIRTGYDSELNVLKAAKFLTRDKPSQTTLFLPFKFPGSTLKDRCDILIMVNWIHLIEPSVLRTKLHEYFEANLEPAGCLIIDTVQDREYKYNHNISFLADGLKCRTEKIGAYKREREVWAIHKL